MSSDTGASILDEALACISQRIAFIIVHPSDKDQNYCTKPINLPPHVTCDCNGEILVSPPLVRPCDHLTFSPVLPVF